MGLVRFIKGNDSKSSLLATELMKILNVIYAHAPQTQKEFTQLCCKAGVCPVTLVRLNIGFYKARGGERTG